MSHPHEERFSGGGPLTPTEELLCAVLTSRVRVEEKASLQEMAAARGISMSELVREAVLAIIPQEDKVI